MTKNGDILVESAKQFDRTLVHDLPEALAVTDLGEGLRLINKSTVELTHALATEILEMDDFSPDRPLDNHHVVRLKTAMDRGTFLSEQVAIITCTCDGKTYRMNGQHTCWARLEMDQKYRCPVTLYKYSAKTEHDMRRLYASIDRNKPRTKGNVVLSYLYDSEEWRGFKKEHLKLLAEGLGVWKWQSLHARKLHDGDDRAYLLMTDYLELGKKIGRFYADGRWDKSRFLRRASVCGAMFATFEKDSEAALSFWSQIRDGTGFQNKTDARLVLRDNLSVAAVTMGIGTRTDKKVSQEEMYRWCLVAWNAWRSGKPVKQLKALLQNDRPKVS